MAEQKIEDGGAAFPHPDLADRSAAPGLTLRQYAAIKLRVPDSGLDWLDAMIQKSRRDAFAGQALGGMLAQDRYPDARPIDFIEGAYCFADAAREEGGGEDE